jgi:hypothetical protein
MASCLLSELKWDVAFGIYVIGGLTVDVALLYCRMNGASDLAVYRQLLEERYLAEDVEEIRKVQDAVGKWEKLRKPINQWLVEYSLNKWIEGVNKTAGVATSFESVFERYRSLRAEKNMPEQRSDRYDCRKNGCSDT